jgi:hypothetical protein
MAIYRPAPPRWRAAAVTGIAGLFVGGMAGWLVGAGTEPDPVDAMRKVRSRLTMAASALEVVAIEYSEAVEAGEVVAETEYEGARSAAARARDLFDEVREPLTTLAPQTTADLASRLEDLIEAIDDTASEAKVAELVDATASTLENFGGP